MNYTQARQIIRHKQALIERHRYINAGEDYWCEYILDDTKLDLEAEGMYDVEIYFCLAYSQGDGACFTGYKYFSEEELTTLGFPILARTVHFGGAVRVESSLMGRSCHEHGTWISAEADPLNELETDSDLINAANEAMMDTWEQQFEGFEEHITDAWRDRMRDIYTRLDEEYEYQTDDAQVWESIKANRMWEGEDWFEEGTCEG